MQSHHSQSGSYATLCWSLHHISTVTITQRWGSRKRVETWKQFKRPMVWADHRSPENSPQSDPSDAKSHLTLFLSPFFSCRGRGLPAHVTSRETWNRHFLQPSLLTACWHICSPLPTLSPRKLCASLLGSRKQDSVITSPAQIAHPNPQDFITQGPFLWSRESAGPVSGGKLLHSSGWSWTFCAATCFDLRERDNLLRKNEGPWDQWSFVTDTYLCFGFERSTRHLKTSYGQR